MSLLMHTLHGFFESFPMKAGAQAVMPVYRFLPGCGKCFGINRAIEAPPESSKVDIFIAGEQAVKQHAMLE